MDLPWSGTKALGTGEVGFRALRGGAMMVYLSQVQQGLSMLDVRISTPKNMNKEKNKQLRHHHYPHHHHRRRRRIIIIIKLELNQSVFCEDSNSLTLTT